MTRAPAGGDIFDRRPQAKSCTSKRRGARRGVAAPEWGCLAALRARAILPVAMVKLKELGNQAWIRGSLYGQPPALVLTLNQQVTDG